MSVQGFWGLQLKPGKSYTQIVTAPFRIAMASLTAEIENEKRTCVSVKVDKRDFVMCTLIPNKIEQQSLDLNFVEGEEVTFFALGDNAVHLTGNYVFSDDEDDMISYSGESEGDDDDEEAGELPATLTSEQIQALLSGEGDLDLEDDDEDDEEFNGEESDEDMDEEEEEEEAPVTKKRPAEVAAKEQPSKKAKKEEAAKKAKEDAAKKAKDEAAKKAKEEQKKKEKEEAAKKAKEEQKKKEDAKKKKEEPKKVTKLPNGLVIEDDKVGDGASCKSGQRIGMRYIGKLTNGKVFDKNTSGKPFYFVLGRGEVIKGWDIGVAGMKVGGQRKLTIPAPLAYGKRGAPPDIPKNATLVFEIKLVSMK